MKSLRKSLRKSHSAFLGLLTVTAILHGLSPTIIHAGAWALPQGRFWGKVTYFQQATDEWYISAKQFNGVWFDAGTRRPYNFEGSYESKAVFIEGFYGVTDRLDVGAQIPYFDQTFQDATRSEPPTDSGFSDLRMMAKFRLLERPLVLTLKGAVKFPTGDFVNEDGLIPVGEGQWDFDFGVQAGRSFWPLPAYVAVEYAYRIRRENEEILRDPGEETLINGEVGYNLTPKLMLATKVELLRGGAGTDFGIRSSSSIKRITYLAPTVSYAVHGSTVAEVAMRFSLNGRNFPAGKQITLGMSTDFDLNRLVANTLRRR